MANILYVYKDQVYANITNKCDCACTFCIRSQQDGVGDAETLWHKVDPTLEDIYAAIDAFDFSGYNEFVFCGYGEPTCSLDHLLASARYVKEKTGLPIRLNSNGLGNLYHKRDIVPELATVIDSVSISLNAPNAEECGRLIKHTQLSIVDVLPQEDIDACQKIADERGVHLKVRKFSKGA